MTPSIDLDTLYHFERSMTVDYLHYGAAMDYLPKVLFAMEPLRFGHKIDAIRYIDAQVWLKSTAREQSTDVIRSFGGVDEPSLSARDVLGAIDTTRRWRRIFRFLCCRGFSFRLCEGLRVGPSLRSNVNIHFALVTDPKLYYTPRVRQDLARFSARHIPRGIGWALGSEQQIGRNKWWFILNIQSDVMSSPFNSLREIFRGWQRLLFLLIVLQAQRRDISFVAIPSTSAVAQAATSGVNIPTEGAKNSWYSLYEGTAGFFDLKLEHTPPIDLQTMSWRGYVECDQFFVANVDALIRQMTAAATTQGPLVWTSGLTHRQSC
jgi:hypothetical protein